MDYDLVEFLFLDMTNVVFRCDDWPTAHAQRDRSALALHCAAQADREHARVYLCVCVCVRALVCAYARTSKSVQTNVPPS